MYNHTYINICSYVGCVAPTPPLNAVCLLVRLYHIKGVFCIYSMCFVNDNVPRCLPIPHNGDGVSSITGVFVEAVLFFRLNNTPEFSANLCV